MKNFVRRFGPAFAWVASLGFVVPGAALAGPPNVERVTDSTATAEVVADTSEAAAPAKPVSKAHRKVSVKDVILGPDGQLLGRLVDPEGAPVGGAEITLTRDQVAVAQAITDAEGVYEFTALREGAYVATSPMAQSSLRVWDADSAPPGAKAEAVLISTPTAVRGQGIDPINGSVVVLAVAGVIISGVTLYEVKQLKDDVKANNAQSN